MKTYSSGMYMRLGFAVAIHVDPDVLLVDEVLAVGDEGFTHKCLDKFAEFRRRGKTILLVTHSLGLVERFCDEALWLDDGRVTRHGDPKRVVGAYLTDVEQGEEAAARGDDARRRCERRRRRADRDAAAADGAPATAAMAASEATRATCSRRPKAAGARARSRSPTSTLLDRDGAAVVRLPLRRADVDSR